MSSPAPANVAAFQELEVLVRALGEELARFRKRALSAEARLKQMEAAGASGDLFVGERLAELEAENRELRERLATASARVRSMLDRVRFLRQQAALGNSE